MGAVVSTDKLVGEVRALVGPENLARFRVERREGSVETERDVYTAAFGDQAEGSDDLCEEGMNAIYIQLRYEYVNKGGIFEHNVHKVTQRRI